MPDFNRLDKIAAEARQGRFTPLDNAANAARRERVDPALAEIGLGVDYDERDEKKQQVVEKLSQFVDVRMLGLEPPPASTTNVAPDASAPSNGYFEEVVLPNAVDLVVNGIGPIPGVQDVLDTVTRGMGGVAPMDEPTPQIVGAPTESGFPTAQVMMTTPEENVEALKNLLTNGDEFIKNQPLTAGVMTLAALGGTMSMAGALKFKPKSYLPTDPTKFFNEDVPRVLSGERTYAHARLPNANGLRQLRDEAKGKGLTLRVMKSKDPDFPGVNVAVFDPKKVNEVLGNVRATKSARGFVDDILARPEIQKTSFYGQIVKPLRDGGVVVTPRLDTGRKFGDVMRRMHTILRRTHPAGEEINQAGRHAVIKNRVLADAWTKIKNDYTGSLPKDLRKDFGRIAAELDQKAATLGDKFDFDAEIKVFPEEMQAALRQHKQVTDSIAGRVRRELLRQGVPEEIVNKWGRDGFYFPKLFTGNWEISAKAPGTGGVDFVTRASTMGEAFSTLNDLKKKGYTLSRLDFDNVIPGEIAARLPRKQLERLIATLKNNADVDRQTILDWFKNKDDFPVVAAKESKKKGFRFKEGRVTSPVTGQEYPFWNLDYDKVMDAYFQSAARFLSLNEFQRTYASAKAKIPATLSKLHAYLEDYHADVMGRHYAESEGFDNSLRTFADAINRGLEKAGSGMRWEPKPMALERWVSTANKVMANIKLSTPAGAMTNALQTFQTLYPRVSTGNFVRAWKDSFTDAGIEEARQAGVLSLPAKLQDIGFTKGGIETERGPLWAFNKAEQKNRVVAYLAGKYEAQTAHGRAVARAFGMDPNDPNFIKTYALDMVSATQFDMSVADLPKVFRGPLRRWAFQFKPFQNALIGSTLELRKMPDPIRSYAKSALGTFAVGGARTVVSPVRLAAIYGISKAYDEIRNKHGEEMANAVVYGFPGLIGMDMSNRVGIDLVPAFGHSMEEKLVNALSGPSIGTIRDMVEFAGLEKKDKDAVYAYLKRLFPQVKMGHSLWNATKEDKWLRDSRGRKLARPDAVDRWLEALAFTTIKRTQAYDVRYELDEKNPFVPDALEKGLPRVRRRIEKYSLTE